jgi:dTDP-4-amino-4,6-dideoxygalactose transaminase
MFNNKIEGKIPFISIKQEDYFFNSARAGLYTLLLSISQGRTLRIGIQPFTCKSVFRAITEAGCNPVFIDINRSFTIDTNVLELKKELIDLLIVTHTFGIPADMEKILTIMSNKLVIEDCAHAFLSEYNNKPCGTWGDAAFFSINYGKFPSIGSGGFVVINNPLIMNNFDLYYQKLPSPSFVSSIIQPFKNLLYSIAFKPLIYGMITYPIFKSKDKRYDFIGKDDFNPHKGFTSNRKVFFRNINRYFEIRSMRREKTLQLLSGLPLDFLNLKVDGNNLYQIPILRKDRDQIYRKFIESGFEGGKHFSGSIEWAIKYGYKVGSCPNAETIADEILTLPNTYWLNDRDMEKILSILSSPLD